MPPDIEPSFPLVSYLPTGGEGEWLREAMTTFAQRVASFLPGDFECYVRVLNPFESHDASGPRTMSWRESLPADEVYPVDPARAAEWALRGPGGAQALTGALHRSLLDPLLEHLAPRTETPERCFFAVWDGFGGSAIPRALRPTLHLPHRDYHLFSGPIGGARTSYSSVGFVWQPANLWWPADHRWCVATEIDFAWTYVGGPRSCVEAILADTRLEAVETYADARW